ncbi:MAG: hypothetical protein FJ242_09035 [Nitrospira sp.]|nr:hypothetical protein [Nitrospira sp.]
MGLTLSKKIGLGIGTLLVIFATFGIILYLMTLNIEKNIKKIIHIEEPASAAGYEMEINLIGTGFAVLGYLHDHDPIHLERIN